MTEPTRSTQGRRWPWQKSPPRRSALDVSKPLAAPITDQEAGAIGRALTYRDRPWEVEVADVWRLVDSIVLLRAQLQLAQIMRDRARAGFHDDPVAGSTPEPSSILYVCECGTEVDFSVAPQSVEGGDVTVTEWTGAVCHVCGRNMLRKTL
jgi:hypothetical protein